MNNNIAYSARVLKGDEVRRRLLWLLDIGEGNPHINNYMGNMLFESMRKYL